MDTISHSQTYIPASWNTQTVQNTLFYSPGRLPSAIIDPGHGGIVTMGHSSAYGHNFNTGYYEKDLVLEISKNIQRLLDGIIYIHTTRSSDKNESLFNRAISAKHGQVFLSIHINPYSSHSEIWIHTCAAPASIHFAHYLLDALNTLSRVPMSLWEGGLAVLHPSLTGTTPACLVELGGILHEYSLSKSNPKNILEIMDYYSNALAKGLVAYFTCTAPAMTDNTAAYGGLAHMLSPGLITYGVPAGVVIRRFLDAQIPSASANQELKGKHTGVDISLSSSAGGGAHDLRRGLEIYATPRKTISGSLITSITIYNLQTGTVKKGLMTSLQGNLTLSHGIVRHLDENYNGNGGRAVLSYVYQNDQTPASPYEFTVFYNHLITDQALPFDGENNKITEEQWRATGKDKGFGPEMKPGTRIEEKVLAGRVPVVIGYLGATAFPHVHIECTYKKKGGSTVFIDPALVLR